MSVHVASPCSFRRGLQLPAGFDRGRYASRMCPKHNRRRGRVNGKQAAMPRYWLMKSEPEAFSIDDLARAKNGTTRWDGVRNYQARNFLRDDISLGDGVLFYHSSVDPPAVVGTARVARAGYPDPTQFDPQDSHCDPDSPPDAPRWFAVDIAFDEKFARPVTLAELRADEALGGDGSPAPGEPPLGAAGGGGRVEANRQARRAQMTEGSRRRQPRRRAPRRHRRPRSRRGGGVLHGGAGVAGLAALADAVTDDGDEQRGPVGLVRSRGRRVPGARARGRRGAGAAAGAAADRAQGYLMIALRITRAARADWEARLAAAGVRRRPPDGVHALRRRPGGEPGRPVALAGRGGGAESPAREAELAVDHLPARRDAGRLRRGRIGLRGRAPRRHRTSPPPASARRPVVSAG